MVCNYGMQNGKPCHDMVEEKICGRFTSIVKCRHHLGPFSKVVNHYNDIAIPPSQVRVSCHEIDTSFHKRTYGDNMMQRSGWRIGLTIINLERIRLLDNENAIMKYGGPKETST